MAADVNALAEPLRGAVSGLINEANAGAAVPRVTLLSGRRSSAQQIQLRKANCGATDYDIYQKPASQCSPVTARPGESQHELGLAADFAGDLGLVEQLAPKYGLVRTVPSERWHYESAQTAHVAGPDSDPPPASSSSSSSSSSGVAGLLGNVPIIGGALSAGAGAAESLAALAAFLMAPKTWLRVLAAIVGGALVLAGIAALALDQRDAQAAASMVMP